MQAIIHEKSSNVPLPKLDLFGVPPTQVQIEKTYVTEHRPISSIEGSPQIQFEVDTLIDEYIDLEKLVIYTKVKLQPMAALKDSKDFEMIAPVAYFGHSIIKQVDIFLNGHQITTSSPTYPYRAYIEAFFGFSKEMKESHLTTALWFDDEEFKEDVPVKHMSKYLRDYKELDLMTRLHSDITFQGRCFPGKSKLTIRILFQDSKFCLMSTGGYKPQLEILDASLFITRSKIAEKTVAAHLKAMSIATAKYPMTVVKVKTFTLQKGSIDASIENIHSGQLPSRIILAFVNNEAFNGSYTKNPYNFQHFNLSHLSLYIGGEQIPNKGFNPDFKNKLFAKELYALYEGMDMVDCDPTFKISRDNFAKGNSFYVFNLAPDLTSGPGLVGHVNKLNYGHVRAAMRFDESLKEPVTVIAYCQFPKMMEIDKDGKVYLDTY